VEFFEKFVREAKCCSILFGRRIYSSLCQGEFSAAVIVQGNLKLLRQ